MLNKRLAGICFMFFTAFALPGCGGGSDAPSATSDARVTAPLLAMEPMMVTPVSIDTFDGTLLSLQRFLAAQDAIDQQASIYATALNELRQGQKQTHWIWFIFPQLVGLGHSPNAQKFGITGLEEAQAYLQHPILGTRLRECFTLLLNHSDKTAPKILGALDAQKLQSSATLFLLAANSMGSEEDRQLFQSVLNQFYQGQIDVSTLQLLPN